MLTHSNWTAEASGSHFSILLLHIQIADFGMSRDLRDHAYYVSQNNLIPIKWTAPEAVTCRKYSSASDVWSYGCLLYEIWTFGHDPYENLPNSEVNITNMK